VSARSARKNSALSSEKREVSEEKTLTELLNTLEEDLCKECTRLTLRQSVERQPVEGQSKHKECTQRELVSSS
jgi:hypothetical protein